MTDTPYPQSLQSIRNQKWLNLIRRLQQMACSQQGLAVITVSIFVDDEGNPILWTSPRMTPFEPKNAAGQFLDLIEKL